MKPKTKKILLISAITLGAIIVLPLGFLGVVATCSACRSTNVSKDSKITNNTGLVQAQGKALYDKNGDYLMLRGVNAGGLLVSEGWMCPYSVGEKLDKNGEIKLDSDGLPTYPKLPMEETLEGFKANTNLTDEERDELVSIYRQNWFGEQDFKNVKDMGLNTIRLPFYWRDILNENDGVFNRKSEEEAFSYLDSFITNCKNNELYCILDLHGAPGGQSGYEHCGTMKSNDVWTVSKYSDATVDLWKYIADHYTNTKPELGEWIATYDLMNEPCAYFDNQDAGTINDICAPVFDKIYQGIRSINDKHVITIEGVWSFDNFVDPAKYGWENVQYETHLYNWGHKNTPYWLYNCYHELHNWFHDYNVPYYIGEFTFYEDADAWDSQLSMYEKRGYSWTMWTYKVAVTGWWTSSWSIYTQKLDLRDGKTKINLKTATYDEIKVAFEATNTANCELSNSYKYVTDFLNKN